MFEHLSFQERIQNAKTTLNTIAKVANRENRNAVRTIFPSSVAVAVAVAVKPLPLLLVPPDEVGLATRLPFPPTVALILAASPHPKNHTLYN